MSMRIFILAALAASLWAPVTSAEVKREQCLAPVPVNWQCARIAVPENYDAPNGRTASVHVVVAHASRPSSKPDAVFFLQGGPGFTGTLVAGRGFADTVGPLLATHDFVVVDQRGVSGDDALICPPEGPPDSLASLAAPVFTETHIKACAANLESKFDLTTFTTLNFARDLEQVRLALGYPAIKLLTGGYGTKIALDYMRLFPSRTESAVLVDPWAMDDRMEDQLSNVSASLEFVLKSCEIDQPCHTFFPNVRTEYRELFSRLAHGGMDLKVAMDGKSSETVHLDAIAVLQWFVAKFHFMKDVSTIPSEIHTLASGTADEQSALGLNIVLSHSAYYSYIAVGEYLSVACSEDVPFEGQPIGARNDVETALHSDLVDKRESCRYWPHKKAPAILRTAIHTDVPSLLVISDHNPGYSLEGQRRAGAQFRRATILELANHGSGFDDDWNICPKPEAVAFLESNGTAPIDTNCGAHFLVRPFTLP